MKYKSVTYYNKNGLEHREDGPAHIRADGSKSWSVNDELHRLDGPAVIRANGTKSWWINYKGYGPTGDEPPEEYLEKLKELGIKFVRGSDDVE